MRQHLLARAGLARLIAAAVFVAVLSCRPAVGGEAPPTLPESLPELAELHAADPADSEIALTYAEAAASAGNAALAADLYADLLAKNPESQLFRLRLILLHEELGDAAKAEQLRRDYMAAVPNLFPAAQAAPVYDAFAPAAATPLRREVYAQPERSGLQFHGRIATGVLYDSNANQGPASNAMSLGDFNNVLIPGVKGKETAGVYLSTGFDLAYRPRCSNGWEWVGDFGFSLRGNFNSDLGDSNNRHTEWGRVATGARWSNENNLFDLRLKAEVFDYEFNTRAAAYGPELFYARAVTDSFQLLTRGGYEWRVYSESARREGSYYHIGEYFRFFLGAPLEDGRRHQFTFGARYLGGDPKQRNFRYDGWEGRASFALELPRKIEVTPFAVYSQEFYKGPATVLETKKRKDDRLTVGVAAAWEFRRNWLLEASYQYTKNWSKSNLYKYDRHLVTGGIAYGF